ncbi:MAG: hydrogenase maturation nickel metallochaperone HypA [Planctomyces sp.]|nr:hydrogenase maturation nickel metallochaperone HypA [Planctomyces sp.]
MHEESLVRALLNAASDVLKNAGGVRVLSLRVEVGPLSGVERLLVETAFERLVDDTPCRGAELLCETPPLVVRCRDCAHEFDASVLRFACPACGSLGTRIVSGDEFRLIDVTIVADDDAAATAPLTADSEKPTCPA